ncbi:MAG: sigma-54-dependent Fis family transcriptional regulator [Gemmatimonadetes bacterium]|nr:sigma-54-dependent Fis family transcriptional regulator [Gemmatimonadota bacterium]
MAERTEAGNGAARSARVLIIDDERSILDTVQILLRGEGFEVETMQNPREALAQLDDLAPDIVLTDIRMPGLSGLEVLAALREHDVEIPVILMTAQASLQSAVQAVNEGAFYYLQKPFSNAELVALCRRAAESRLLTRENKALKREIRRRDDSTSVRPAGRNRAFVDVVKLAEMVAPTDSTVLITGESGTGKEVVARYIHRLSERENGPFISVNCGALPENLLESELFGHVKGSFTGAHKDKDGLLVAARGGTFFLDEVAEMSPALQVKLLRAIQEREIVPVGATQTVDIDVRIIAATNRDLDQEIRRGTFRSDLYYRLNVIALHLPPLRDREDDIALLAEHFLRRLAADTGQDIQLSEDAVSALQHYDWPGNVRELENALERAAILTKGSTIALDSLPSRIVEPAPSPLISDRPAANPTLELVERAYILWVLQAEGGNKARAAEVLGIDPSTLYRKLSRYELSEA